MRIEDGVLILERVTCSWCDGTGKVTRFKICENYNKPVNRFSGRKCPKCGAKNKHSHGTVGTYEKSCDHGGCDGGIYQEGICDTIPQEMWESLDFKVYRSDRGISMNEALLGFGCVYSCLDYGQAYHTKDDNEIIVRVREHKFNQAIDVVNRDTRRLCDHVGIFVNRGGFSVRAVFEDRGKVESEIETEIGYRDGLTRGAALADIGLNGTMAPYVREGNSMVHDGGTTKEQTFRSFTGAIFYMGLGDGVRRDCTCEACKAADRRSLLEHIDRRLWDSGQQQLRLDRRDYQVKLDRTLQRVEQEGEGGDGRA